MALTVKSKSLTAPPGGESEGDTYIPATGSINAWAGHDDDFAQSTGGGWAFETPKDGFKAWILDEQKYTVFRVGTGWISWSPPGGGTGDVDTWHDGGPLAYDD